MYMHLNALMDYRFKREASSRQSIFLLMTFLPVRCRQRLKIYGCK